MPDIQHAIQIDAGREVIYPLVATAVGFRQWWASDVTESPQAVELGFFNRASIYRLRLTADEPPVRAKWECDTGDEWGGTYIEFRLQGRPAGTLLRFTHGNWRSTSDYFVACNTTWGELMFRLKAAAEGVSRGPLFQTASLAY
jgi:hypothetical protein